MAKKTRFPAGCSSGFVSSPQSEQSGGSGGIDTERTASEDSNDPRRKCIDLNSAARDVFGVPIRVLPLSKMSASERKNLVVRLRSELEQIQSFRKRVQLQRTNAVALSSTSDILSCSNVQNVQMTETMAKCSALASNHGRKSNPLNNKGSRGWNRGNSGRFESATTQPSTSSTSSLILMNQCESLLKKLMQHNYGHVFNEPVDPVKLNIPDYLSIIKHPMDFGTIRNNLALNKYLSPSDFLSDVRLTFSNALLYNPSGTPVHSMAETLSKFFEVRWKVIEKKVLKDSSPILEKTSLKEEKETPIPPSKKRRFNPNAVHSTFVSAPVTQIMTAEEKHLLSRKLEAVLGDLPDNIVEFLKKQCSNGKEITDDEIEIDIDDLSDSTLFTLQKLIDDYMQKKEKCHAKSEPCEIELLNESGFSNSSMQLSKGNDLVDEDIDTGKNEPPVTSHPSMDIENETAQRTHKYSKSTVCEKSHQPNTSSMGNSVSQNNLDDKLEDGDLLHGNQSISELDQFSQKLNSVESDGHQDGEIAHNIERQVSPDKRYRAALLKNRFVDTILKAREKTFNQVEKGDPEKLKREREELEMQKRKEKARLQAEAKAAEDGRKRAEAEVAAEAKRKREVEREAARQALLKMEKTVEINENSGFLEDLAMLRDDSGGEAAGGGELQQMPTSSVVVDDNDNDDVEEMCLDDQSGVDCCRLGSFKFGSNINPLEQLGLYMKQDDDEEEPDHPPPPPFLPSPPQLETAAATTTTTTGGGGGDVEEGEID
ncbi:transcription factor GTE8-like [Impatiens glandulifera]|uniref:transcription factor GTE8-like n=1 Tax=Impatiens glandulifera TaxID=253017 RepID=UPI001FB0E004|nr:transcription factor GTE8-like [Impatiens glandulifera]